jgi:hypothetical protein
MFAKNTNSSTTPLQPCLLEARLEWTDESGSLHTPNFYNFQFSIKLPFLPVSKVVHALQILKIQICDCLTLLAVPQTLIFHKPIILIAET